jgi:transposase
VFKKTADSRQGSRAEGKTPRFTRWRQETLILSALYYRAGKSMTRRLVPGNAGKQEITVPLLMDRAYADFKTRFTARDLRFQAVVPPKSNAADKREYDKELYKGRNGIERFFRRLKAFRTVFTRYDKLDIIFTGSVLFASIIILLRCVDTP